MNGALRRLLKGWKVSDFGSIDQALDSFYKIVYSMRDKYVDSSVPRVHRPAPWWSHTCTVAFKKKDEAFKKRVSCLEAYKTAKELLKVHERVAYAIYREKLTAKLSSDCTRS